MVLLIDLVTELWACVKEILFSWQTIHSEKQGQFSVKEFSFS